MSDTVVKIDKDGQLTPNRAASKLLAEVKGSYELVASLDGLVMLRGLGGQAHGHVVMAGEIITRMSVMEVANVIASANWRGELAISNDEGVRRLTFDQGALKGATSSFDADKLGEVMYRFGALTREQLDLVNEMDDPARKYSSLLIEKNLIQPDKLFSYLQRQAQEIFYAALVTDAGNYVFRTPEEGGQLPTATPLHLPIQSLLMEGVQRIDEMALFRDRIPNSEMCPVVKADAKLGDLDDQNARVFSFCDGARDIDEIARLAGLSEFQATKSVYHLLQRKLVELRAGSKIDEEGVRRLVTAFNQVTRDIFFAVATYGRVNETRNTLLSWLEGSDYTGYFAATSVDEFGTLKADDVLESIRGANLERPLESLHHALHEFASFALFAATNALPRDQEHSLSRDVHRRLQAIRL